MLAFTNHFCSNGKNFLISYRVSAGFIPGFVCILVFQEKGCRCYQKQQHIIPGSVTLRFKVNSGCVCITLLVNELLFSEAKGNWLHGNGNLLHYSLIFKNTKRTYQCHILYWKWNTYFTLWAIIQNLERSFIFMSSLLGIYNLLFLCMLIESKPFLRHE